MTTIPESIMREAQAAYHSAWNDEGSASQSDIYLAIARALQAAEERGRQAERERCEAIAVQPFCVLFLDGRNEHGAHVLPSYPRSFETTDTNIEDEAETIISQAESLGFAVGSHVWAEFDWTDPQIDNEGRTEFSGYWEFKQINPDMTRAITKDHGNGN